MLGVACFHYLWEFDAASHDDEESESSKFDFLDIVRRNILDADREQKGAKFLLLIRGVVKHCPSFLNRTLIVKLAQTMKKDAHLLDGSLKAQLINMLTPLSTHFCGSWETDDNFATSVTEEEELTFSSEVKSYDILFVLKECLPVFLADNTLVHTKKRIWRPLVQLATLRLLRHTLGAKGRPLKERMKFLNYLCGSNKFKMAYLSQFLGN